MRQPTLVAIADTFRFRRPRPWVMIAIALLLTCGIMRTGNGSQGAADKDKAIAALQKRGPSSSRTKPSPTNL